MQEAYNHQNKKRCNAERKGIVRDIFNMSIGIAFHKKAALTKKHKQKNEYQYELIDDVISIQGNAHAQCQWSPYSLLRWSCHQPNTWQATRYNNQSVTFGIFISTIWSFLHLLLHNLHQCNHVS